MSAPRPSPRPLAGRKYVSEPTRKRIYEAVAALDYQPSAAGRMLRTGVTHALGVITPPPDAQPFTHYSSLSRVLDGIGEVAGANGYSRKSARRSSPSTSGWVTAAAECRITRSWGGQ